MVAPRVQRAVAQPTVVRRREGEERRAAVVPVWDRSSQVGRGRTQQPVLRPVRATNLVALDRAVGDRRAPEGIGPSPARRRDRSDGARLTAERLEVAATSFQFFFPAEPAEWTAHYVRAALLTITLLLSVLSLFLWRMSHI